MTRPWPWAAAAATLAIAIIFVVAQRTPKQTPPTEIAQVIRRAEIPAPTPAAAPVPAPERALRKVAPPPPPKTPPARPAARDEVREDALADKLQVQPKAPDAAQIQEATQALEAAQAQDGGRGGAVRGFAAGAPAAARQKAENLVAKVDAGFAFNYEVRSDGFLQIVPTAPGYLSMTSNGEVVFPSRAVTAGAAVRVPIPPQATSLIVGFSAVEGITGSPARRDEASGTVTDQDPPNAKILIQLFLKPATQ
jgi:hypothetical protein